MIIICHTKRVFTSELIDKSPIPPAPRLESRVITLLQSSALIFTKSKEKCSRHPWIMSESQSRLKYRLSIYQMSLSKPFWKKIIPLLFNLSLVNFPLLQPVLFVVPTLVIVWHTLTMNVSDWTAQIYCSKLCRLTVFVAVLTKAWYVFFSKPFDINVFEYASGPLLL